MEFQVFQDENGQTYIQQVVPDDEFTDGETSENISEAESGGPGSQSGLPTYPQEDWNVVGSTVVVGLTVVFSILAILIFIFWAFGKIMSKPEISKNVAPLEPSPKLSKALPDPVQRIAAASSDGIPGEVVAAITAAVTAFGENTGRKLRVAGIERSEKSQRTGRSRWSQAGVFDNIKR